MILHCVLGGIQQSSRKSVCFFQFPEAVFQRFQNPNMVLWLYGPDRHRTRMLSFVGVGNVKVVFQPVVCFSKDCNPSGTTVYPAPKLFVPAFDFQNSRNVRTLRVDK